VAGSELHLPQDVATDRRTLRSRSGRRVGPARLTRRCRARAGRTSGPAIGEPSATSWVDRLGVEKPVGLEDILIIAPYNAQVFDLKDRFAAWTAATDGSPKGESKARL
jgi:hypothetical protein